jgi:hypothetical protein
MDRLLIPTHTHTHTQTPLCIPFRLLSPLLFYDRGLFQGSSCVSRLGLLFAFIHTASPFLWRFSFQSTVSVTIVKRMLPCLVTDALIRILFLLLLSPFPPSFKGTRCATGHGCFPNRSEPCLFPIPFPLVFPMVQRTPDNCSWIRRVVEGNRSFSSSCDISIFDSIVSILESSTFYVCFYNNRRFLLVS